MAESELAARLREAFRGADSEVPTSALGRLWRTGRGAAGVAASSLAGRLRGRGEGLGAAEVEAVGALVAQLGELKGLAMKAGQVLSFVDPSLHPQLREVLALLQTQAPASAWETVEGVVREALGARADALLGGMERAPIAVASIGQVHRGRLPDGTGVAVKVRHRGIEDAMRSDFRAGSRGASVAALLMPGASESVRSTLEETRTALLEECDFLLEAERQERFGRLFSGDATVVVPAVERAWCAPAVLVTRWTPGRSLEAWLAEGPAQEARDRLGVALFSFYVGTLYRHGLFHADPHPGNYAVAEDGRLVVYDFGCVRAFSPEEVAGFVRLVRATRADDLAAMCAALEEQGATPPRDGPGRQQLRTFLRGFFAPMLEAGPRPVSPGAALDATQMMRDKRFLARLALPGRFTFLFRLRFGLYAVLARLGAVADWAALEAGWAQAHGDSPR
jgi:predicted unusual protein kinase regulating ubiquinone biosynthesis (AarF/ABC1/UbiB family)